MTLVWGDPPPTARLVGPQPKRTDLHLAMEANPGRWLIWSERSSRANASNLRHRYPQYEVATEPVEAGAVRIYCRLRGESTTTVSDGPFGLTGLTYMRCENHIQPSD